jgi:hypothetical protein
MARSLLPGSELTSRTQSQAISERTGLPGRFAPDPDTVVPGSGQAKSPVSASTQSQQPAPHLRVVSRREKGKSCPTRPRGKETAFRVPQGGAAVGVRDALGGAPGRFVSSG